MKKNIERLMADLDLTDQLLITIILLMNNDDLGKALYQELKDKLLNN